MTRNLGLKVISLLTAILIWAQITLMADHQSKANLTLRLVPTVLNPLPENAANRISCSVEGRGLDILKLRYSQAYVQMTTDDYAAANEKNYSVHNIPPNLKVKVTGIVPEFVGNTINGRQKTSGEQPGRVEGASSEATVERFIDVKIDTGDGRRFFPDTVKLQVQGPESRLVGIGAKVTTVVDKTPQPNGKYNLRCEVPSGVSLVKYTPTEVRLIR